MSVTSLLKDTVIFSGQTKYGGSIGFTLDKTVAWPSVISSKVAAANAITWSADGTYFYTVETDKVKQYGLQYVYGPIEDSAVIVETSENALDYAPTSISVSADGTTMFLSSGRTINSYTLSTPYVLTNFLFYEQLNLSNSLIGFTENTIKSFRFGNSGRVLYVYGGDTASIYEIPLANAYQLSTSSNITTQVQLSQSTASGIAFANSGSSFYITDNGTINQYNVRTPYSINGANLVGSFDFANPYGSIAPGLSAIKFSTDGTKVYTLQDGRGFRTISLSQPYTIATAITPETNVKYSPYLYNIITEVNPVGFDVSPDGKKLFVVGYGKDDVVEYRLSEAYNPNTAVIANVFSVTTQDSVPYSAYFGNSGYSFYVAGGNDIDVTQYNMTQPYNANTATFANVNTYNYHPAGAYKALSTGAFLGGGVSFTPDGNTMLMHAYTVPGWITPVALRKPWDISTIVNGATPLMSLDPQGVRLSNDGKTMFVHYAANINQYSLWVPWEPGSATYQKHFSTSSYETNLGAVEFSEDGNYMYITGKASNSINRFSLATPWDIGSPSFVSNLFLTTVAANVSSPVGLDFKPDGNTMYVYSDLRDQVYTYNLATPWDTSTASNTNSYSIGAFGKYTAIHFSPDGYKLFLNIRSGAIYEYRLPTPWVFNNTVAYQRNTTITGSGATPAESGTTGFDFSTDGTRIITVGTTVDHARKFFNIDPWDISATLQNGRQMITPNRRPVAGGWTSSGNSYIYLSDYDSRIIQHSANVPYDFYSIRQSNTQAVLSSSASLGPDPRAIKIQNNYIWALSQTSRIVYRFEMTPADSGQEPRIDKLQGAFDPMPSGAGLSLIDVTSQGFDFSNDGTNVFVAGGSTVYSIPLSTAYNFKTMANTRLQNYTIPASFSGGRDESTLTGIKFANLGNTVFLTGDSRESVYSINLPAPYTFAGATYSNTFANISYITTSLQDIELNNIGNVAYVLDRNSRRVYTLNLPTTNSANNASFYNYPGSKILNLSSVESLPANTAANTRGVAFDFSTTGTDLFFIPARGSDLTFANTQILQYEVPTTSSWDIGSFGATTTLTPVATANVNKFGLNTANVLKDFKISDNGRHFLLLGSDRIVQVQNLSTPQTFFNKTIYSNPSSLPRTKSASYVLIAGGGGTAPQSGGGGAGGVLTGNVTINLSSANSFIVTVGAGGTGGTSDPAASNGGNTIFSSIVAVGGGKSISTGGSFGGSGGGAAWPVNVSGAQGKVRQGTMGGNSYVGPSPGSFSGGGGGAGQAGFSAGPHGSAPAVPGDQQSYLTSKGGDGVRVGFAPGDYGQPSTTGGSWFAGGGGGSRSVFVAQYLQSIGGLGGGGGGASYNPAPPSYQLPSYAGNVNTGGGAGGGYNSTLTYAGKAGGSGIAIIYYNNSNVIFSGGDISIDTAQTTVQVRHIFTSSNVLIPLQNESPLVSARILVVGGGGAGGLRSGSPSYAGGGGGAGGVLEANINIAAFSGAVTTIIVGAGGSASSSGSLSKLNQFVASGGGRGGVFDDGIPGGSGGGQGAGAPNPAAFKGAGNISGQFPWEGYPGGTKSGTSSGGGGGGAGGAGGNGNYSPPLGYYGGDGGAGRLINWIPSTVGQATPTGQYFGGGGSGDGDNTPGTPGLGGGGNRTRAGNVNTGGGGGGAITTANTLGGSGVVIVRYSGNARFTGGIVESANGFTFHIFTGSNTLVGI